ncbi:DUF1287 domain-containing protein [Gallaecimonas pentaromativorans]|uniref:DUF1287 domain-containing protein n=1 Tax=Gallaecimonas pentaromativorans TaxID=584787 RepID=A0A3N1P733_9GAMM|nr:DUF1287 domain-containing protein [Gallaecimonas pentaromativorans]ROQ24323.1 hypothetical protein EDC28_107205 [Gallaecimonas pentaromativorans]
MKCLFPLMLLLASGAQATEAEALVAAAKARTEQAVRYDGRYFTIGYPGGDVPAGLGVCTDVVIRSYRRLGVDLQQKVHEDMAQHFALYPSKRIWGLSRPDSNIDHRRVPNLQVFFSRHGQSLPVSQDPAAYRPGDLVTWMLPGNLPHIGIVSDQRAPSGNLMVVHNIGRGPEQDDSLLRFPITGHYRYFPQ